jgi:hypothetical protein
VEKTVKKRGGKKRNEMKKTRRKETGNTGMQK